MDDPSWPRPHFRKFPNNPPSPASRFGCRSLRTRRRRIRGFASAVRPSLPLPLAGITRTGVAFFLPAISPTLFRRFSSAPTPHRPLSFVGTIFQRLDLCAPLRLSLNRSMPDLPVPAGILGTLAGKKAAADRLCGSLQVDSSRFRRTFDWTPPFTVRIAATAAPTRGSLSFRTPTFRRPA